MEGGVTTSGRVAREDNSLGGVSTGARARAGATVVQDPPSHPVEVREDGQRVDDVSVSVKGDGEGVSVEKEGGEGVVVETGDGEGGEGGGGDNMSHSLMKIAFEMETNDDEEGGSVLQRGASGESIQRDASGKSIQRDASGKSIQRDASGESIQRDASGESIQREGSSNMSRKSSGNMQRGDSGNMLSEGSGNNMLRGDSGKSIQREGSNMIQRNQSVKSVVSDDFDQHEDMPVNRTHNKPLTPKPPKEASFSLTTMKGKGKYHTHDSTDMRLGDMDKEEEEEEEEEDNVNMVEEDDNPAAADDEDTQQRHQEALARELALAFELSLVRSEVIASMAWEVTERVVVGATSLLLTSSLLLTTSLHHTRQFTTHQHNTTTIQFITTFYLNLSTAPLSLSPSSTYKLLPTIPST